MKKTIPVHVLFWAVLRVRLMREKRKNIVQSAHDFFGVIGVRRVFLPILESVKFGGFRPLSPKNSTRFEKKTAAFRGF